MIRSAIMLGFWALLMPFAALFGFPWTILTGDISFLYRISMWGAMTGVRLAGVRVETVGLSIESTRLEPTFSCRTTFRTLIRPS